MADQSSSSEGYESSDETKKPVKVKRRPSMDNIRRFQEESFITQEQGETFSHQFGPECQFISTSVSQFEGATGLMIELLRKLDSSHRATRRRSTFVDGLKQILPTPKLKKNRDREESNASTASDHSPASESPVSSSPVSEPVQIPQIEVQPSETTFPATKPAKKCGRSLFKRNQTAPSGGLQVEGSSSSTQKSAACAIM
jgi:hypothetical protein